MNAPTQTVTRKQAEELAAQIRAEISNGFNRLDPKFQLSGGDVHGIRVQSTSLRDVPVDYASSLGIDFDRMITQPLIQSGMCEAMLYKSEGKFTGKLVVSYCPQR